MLNYCSNAFSSIYSFTWFIFNNIYIFMCSCWHIPTLTPIMHKNSRISLAKDSAWVQQNGVTLQWGTTKPPEPLPAYIAGNCQLKKYYNIYIIVKVNSIEHYYVGNYSFFYWKVSSEASGLRWDNPLLFHNHYYYKPGFPS